MSMACARHKQVFAGQSHASTAGSHPADHNSGPLQLTSAPLMHLTTSHLCDRSAVEATSWLTWSSSTDNTCSSSSSGHNRGKQQEGRQQSGVPVHANMQGRGLCWIVLGYVWAENTSRDRCKPSARVHLEVPTCSQPETQGLDATSPQQGREPQISPHTCITPSCTILWFCLRSSPAPAATAATAAASTAPAADPTPPAPDSSVAPSPLSSPPLRAASAARKGVLLPGCKSLVLLRRLVGGREAVDDTSKDLRPC
jgi:hypothetical protein